MTLEDLIAQVRVDTDDLETSYLSTDTAITAWLNEAEEEACMRANLIHDVSTPAVCTIAVTALTSVYSLHSSVLDITSATFTPTGSTTAQDLYLTDRYEQDRSCPGWRTVTDLPKQLIQTDKTVQLGCIPSTDGILQIECNRLPLVKIEDSTTESPEIGRVHHRYLVYWAEYRCYSRPDAEIFNENRAATALADFTKVFGLRPDAKHRKDFQSNRPLFNKAVW